MLSITLDKSEAVVTLKPEGRLSQEDFETAVRIIDPFIKIRKTLTGIIIDAHDFSAWDEFAAYMKHLTFIRTSHRKLKRIAWMGDMPDETLRTSLTDHFVSAQVQTFPSAAAKEAKAWILEAQNEA